LPEAKRHHLQPVLHAFNSLGIREYELAKHEEISMSNLRNTEGFEIGWSWRPMNVTQFGPLQKYHRFNHLPGTYCMLSKKELYKNILDLQGKHGEENYNFVPKQYNLPHDKDSFIKAFHERNNLVVDDPRVQKDKDFGKRWLIKSQAHRGVSFFTGLDQLGSIMHNETMVAQCIEPLLIDGHKFDMGIHVAITSLDPMRIYIYDNAVIRICKLPYPDNLNGNSDKQSYVVVDYNPPWENNALKEYYDEVPTPKKEGTNHFEVLKKHMDSQGISGAEFEKTIRQDIVRLILGSRPHILRGLKYNRRLNPTANFQPEHFFELFRFDFVVDSNGKPWLMEVNLSPNLKEKKFFKGATDRKVKENVVKDLLSMVTLQHTERPEISIASSRYCDAHCNKTLVREFATKDCWSCPFWFSQEEREILQHTSLEYSHRGNYRLAFPEIAISTPPASMFLTQTSRDNLIEKYIATFDPLHAAVTTLRRCIAESQCNSHGDCILGKCACRFGYEGENCEVPKYSAAKMLFVFATIALIYIKSRDRNRKQGFGHNSFCFFKTKKLRKDV